MNIFKNCLIISFLLISLNSKAQYVDFSLKNSGDSFFASELDSTFIFLRNNTGKVKYRGYISQQPSFPISNPNPGWEFATLVFNSETLDNYNLYDNTTGELIANKNMRLKVDISLWHKAGINAPLYI